jgi:hypothetical protein
MDFSRAEGAESAERKSGPCDATYCQIVTCACVKKAFLPFLRSAISRIHSFLTKLIHHEDHEDHEEKTTRKAYSTLRVLRGENLVVAGRAVIFAPPREPVFPSF